MGRATASGAGARGRDPVERGGWEGLGTLIRARLIVATLALPVGVLLRPEAAERSWRVLVTALLAVGVGSCLWALGARLRRGLRLQTYLQLLGDVAIVTWLASVTGGRESQFVLFYALVVITGGLLGELTGGLAAAAASGTAFVLLPSLAARAAPVAGTGHLPPPGMLLAFLGTMGVLAGILGHRVRNTHRELAARTRELDRVRVDNDAVLRHLTTGVVTVDEAGLVAYLNPAAEHVLGLAAEAVRGRTTSALPARLAPLGELLRATLTTGAARQRAELLVQTEAGAGLPLGISTNLLTHEGGPSGVVAVFQDLTEAREMERRVRRSETLAEVGALSAAIAHELRNGLNPISGSVEYLQRELKLEGENAVLMDLILIECGRLNRFITELLSYSRDRDLVLEPLDLNEHLAELCEGLVRDPRRPASVAVRFEPCGAGCGVEGDREQLRQVWLNLAGNALEAMQAAGGTLLVRWRVDGRRRAVVEFTDTGPGIAAEDLPRIGQPFFTTKQGGTGLGVAIAQRIVERHGGQLAFESSPGRGTVARVTLPERDVRMARAA